jgi:hypothetical protein
MLLRGPLLICALGLAGSVAAQSAAPSQTTGNDRWEPATAATSSTAYRADRLLPGTARTSESPFHFREPSTRGPAYKPPPQANDKATVMGKQRPWQNGRPPVDCSIDPRDPACH